MSDTEVHSTLVVLFRGLLTIAGYYRKKNGKKLREPQVERLVPMCGKTNVLGLRNFLWNKFGTWASNVSCVEEVWNNFKESVLESMECFET
jgi:hypothetical protein